MNHYTPNIASGVEIERLLHHMPSVAFHSENTWAKDFAQSVTRQARRKSWRPSPKQVSIMRGLVSDLFADGSNDGGDFGLIEN
jgi:hypothetical protein